MATPLLTTKLYIPPVRPELVLRPHLIERLNEGLDHRLTLVSAPAGFGKTTLLTEWASSCGRPVAWLSLDEGDNDLARFMAYFVAALETIQANIGQGVLGAFQAPRPPQMESVLTGLINEIAALPEPFVLVLDDYHLITFQPIHDALAFLLDHLPPHAHLVMAGRSDPPLPIARLRGRGQLTELRQSDLRFTPQEAARFLNQAMGLQLSTDDVAALSSRTEGWIAGLQMAAVSMQGRDDVASFIQAFTGSNIFVLDYLVEEVLHGQVDDVQSFLLQTSILDRLSGPLCEAVIGGETEGPSARGQATLEMLEHSNLFIVRLDDERRWYRYHRLFADLLRQRLRQLYPDLLQELHRRASEWYERNGFVGQAIHHALSAEDFERGADLVEGMAESIMMRSEAATFQKWVEALPDDVFRTRPLLGVYHAISLLLSGHPLDVAEARLQDAVEADTDSIISGQVAAFRGLIAAYRGEAGQTVELARRALEILPEDSLFFRSLVAGYLGLVYLQIGDYEAAAQTLPEAARVSEQAGNVTIRTLALCHLAELAAMRGQLHEARAIYEQALESAVDDRGRRQPIAGVPLMGLGQLMVEWNDFDAGLRYLTEGIELVKRYGEIAAIGGYMGLARAKFAQGDAKGALEVLQTADEVAQRFDAMQVDDIYVAGTRARLSMLQGDVQTALRWVEQRGLDREPEPDQSERQASAATLPPFYLFERIILAQVRLGQGRADQALEVVEPLLRGAESLGQIVWVVRALVVQALAFQAQGEVEQALAALERALSLAEPGGYLRLFVDEGEPMARLLRQAESRGIAPEYVKRLLAAFDVSGHGPEEERLPQPKAQSLIEPLSDRELEVLRLLTSSLSSTEMAEELFISVNTIRTHIRTVYSKLGVHSRYEAVARAKELGLL
jgi:LuxR family maltose regulon positive regulatory protein